MHLPRVPRVLEGNDLVSYEGIKRCIHRVTQDLIYHVLLDLNIGMMMWHVSLSIGNPSRLA